MLSLLGLTFLMKLNQEGIDFLVGFERIRYKAYRDNKGWSSGIGHYILPHEPWMLTATLTTSQVKVIFAKDCYVLEAELNKLLLKHKVVLSQRQYSALFSCYYNMGMGKFLNSGIMQALQSKDQDKITEAFMRMTKGINAIALRRASELAFFFS